MTKRSRVEQFEEMAALPSYKTRKIYDHVGEELQKIRRNSENDYSNRDVDNHQPYFRDDTMDFGMRKRRKSGKENTSDTMSCHEVLDSIMMFKSITMDRHANFFIEQEVSLDEVDDTLDFMPKDRGTRDVFVKKEPVFPDKSSLLVFGKGSNMYNPIVIFDGKEVDIEEDGVEISEDKDETIEVINLDDSSEHENESTCTFEDVKKCNSKQFYEQKWSRLSINNFFTERISKSDRIKLDEPSSHLRGTDDVSDDFAKHWSVLPSVAKPKYNSSESTNKDLTEAVPILTVTLSEGKRQVKTYLQEQTMTEKDTYSKGFPANNGQIQTHSPVKVLTSYKSTETKTKGRESRQLKDRYENKQDMFLACKELAHCEQFQPVRQGAQKSINTKASKVTTGIVNEALAITRRNMKVSIGKELNTNEKTAQKIKLVQAKVPGTRNAPSVGCRSECSTNNITASDPAEKVICNSAKKASSHTEAHLKRHDHGRYRTESRDKSHGIKDGNSERNNSNDRGCVRKGKDNRKNISYDRDHVKDKNRNTSDEKRYGRKYEEVKRNISEERRLERKDEEIKSRTSEDRRYGKECREIKSSTSGDRRHGKECAEIKRSTSEERRHGRKDEYIKRNKLGDKTHGKKDEDNKRNTLDDKRHGRLDENSKRNISKFNVGGSSSDRSGICSASISENKPKRNRRPRRQRKKFNKPRENDSYETNSLPIWHCNRNQTSCSKDNDQQYHSKYKNISHRTFSIRSTRDKYQTDRDYMSCHNSWNKKVYERVHMEIPWDPICCHVCRSQFRSYQDLLQHVSKFNHCPFKSSYTCNTVMYLCFYCTCESKTFRKILMHYRAAHGIYFRQYGYKQVMIQALCRI